MKKSKLLMIPAIVLAGFLGVMVSNLDNVSAANNECSAAYNEDTYMDKIEISQDGGTTTLTNVSPNLYYVITYSDSNGETIDDTRHYADANGTITVEIPVDGKIYLSFGLENSDGTCEAGSFVGMKTINYPTSNRNTMYDSEACKSYRNDFSDNKTMKEAVSYCFEEYVNVQYSEETVLAWINAARESYNNGHTEGVIPGGEGYQNVDNVDETIKLTCDLFSTGNYETMHKYTHTGTTNTNNCKVTCREDIEVNFSDPVATEAGLCFQYLIEIKSKVDCTAEYTAPMPTPRPACVESPVCTQANGHQSDMGGPNEDFDVCVKECDGGKYSQKCIDKCYEEVYESDEGNSKVSNNNSSNLPSFMFDNFILPVENSYLTKMSDSKGCITLSEMAAGQGTAEQIYNQQQNNPGGRYVNGSWVPDSSGCNPSLGQYYFSTVAKTAETLRALRGQIYVYWIGMGPMQHWYGAGSSGFLVRTNAIQGTTCLDSCYWTNNCGANTVATQAQSDREYQQALKEYNDAKAACESKAVECSNERTDYEIVVENKDNNDTDENVEDWTENFNAHQNMNSSTVVDDWLGSSNSTFESMVKLTAGECQGEDDGWDYHNIITFPGTWINNKTGRPVHSMEPGKEDFYTYVGNEYCTKLNSIPVNTAWYDWKVKQGGDASSLTDDEKQEIIDNTEMNITGTISNYGYFGWNFEIGCFYAIGDPTSDCDPDDPDCDDDDDDPDPKKTPDSEDYRFRSISLDNLFPSSESGSTSRTPGFNWSCEATNLENEDYPVQPVALIEEIQRLGDGVYSDQYIDYEINLTSETMAKIRQYNRDNDNDYSKPTNDSANLNAGNKKTSGVTVYKSYLLHEVLNSNELVKEGLIGCNNQTSAKTCQGIIEDTSGCMREYQNQSALLKGAR